MNQFDRIQTRLENAFPKFLNCFSIDTRSDIKIIDYEGLHELRKSYLVNDDNTITTKHGKILIDNLTMEKTFKVSNIKKVGFIPIDGEDGLSDEGGCDFVVFDDKDFCFIELKLNATSEARRAIRINRIDALEQLSKTIDSFNDKLARNYCDLNLEAYVCTPKMYPRLRNNFNDIAVEFLEKHKGVKLSEKDEKICR